MTNASPDATKRHWSKRALFLTILAVAAGVAGLISLVVDKTFIQPSLKELKVAVVAPLSGRDAPQGEQILRGASLYVDQVNKDGGINGRPLKLVALDDSGDAGEAVVKAADAGVVGVVGHWSSEAAAAAATVYRERGLPLVTASPDPDARAPVNPWVFKTSYDRLFEIRFLANYVRNVVGEKIVSIIRQEGEDGERLSQAFDEVYQRFGTRIVYNWAFDPTAPDAEARLGEITGEIIDKKLIGAILILGDANASAKVLTKLRRQGVANRVVGPRVMATSAFQNAMREEWRATEATATSERKAPPSVSTAFNGVLTVSPLLFDTAGELAQGFKNSYQKAHRSTPDWAAATGFDAMRLLLFAHGRQDRGDAPIEASRARIRDRLASLNGTGLRVESLFGPVAFNPRGVTAPQALIGTYDGSDLVAALTQLSPIREENVGNYLDELLAGRALYVNDRFMYKTNVVYTGIKLDKVTGLDTANNTVSIEFGLWFRWRGGFEPQDVVFVNAVEPVAVGKPEREAKNGDMTYRFYRLKGKFFLNYSAADRPYGSQEIGLAFRHRTMARNNLMYVSDVLGMDLNTGSTLAEQLLKSNLVFDPTTNTGESSMFQSLLNLIPLGASVTDPLVQLMNRSQVLAGVAGWVLDHAWVSQDVARRGAEGDPVYVGFGKPQPEFSQLDMGCLLKPDQIDVRDIVPADWFPFIAIFSLVGAIVAMALDRKDRGQFWRMQTLGLRLICWPLLLLSVGNLLLDYALREMSTSSVDTIVVVYSSLWWLVPARLAVFSMERFIWVPLEMRAGRKIPNVVRMIVALIIYLFAGFGVVAFVMGKTITSLLATSGLMAMIIGLAVQANLANIFSGIVLNLERPFSVGDFIKLNAGVMGQVIDITWRTIRIRHLEGHLVCLANAKVSETEIHNYSNVANKFIRLNLCLDPRHDPRTVARCVREVLATFDCFAELESNFFGADCQFKGVECQNGTWLAVYRVKFYLIKGNDDNKIIHELWSRVWERLRVEGMDWTIPTDGVVIDNEPPLTGAALPAPVQTA